MNEDRIALTQEILVAFVDQELPQSQSATVAAALAHDPAARETVRRLQVSAQIAKRVSLEALNEPIPLYLVEAVKRKMRGEIAARRSRRASRLLPALAASIIVLILGGVAGYLVRDMSGGYSAAEATGADALTANYEATLQGSLESGAAAGQSFEYDSPGLGQGKITLGASFTTSFGGACREFGREETRASGHTADSGIACRAPNGSWNIMLVRRTS